MSSTSSNLNISREKARKKHKRITTVTIEAGKADVPVESTVVKAKVTGRDYKSRFVKEALASRKWEKLKNSLGEKCVHSASNEKRHMEEHVQSTPKKKRRRLRKKYLQCSPPREDIGTETSHFDERGSPILSDKSNMVNSAVPSQLELSLENVSNEIDIGGMMNEIRNKCEKRMKKIVRKQEQQIREFTVVWEDKISKVLKDKKLEAAVIRAIYGKTSTAMNKLKILDDKYAKKEADNILLRDMQLKDLEAEHLAARNEESEKAAGWLSKAEFNTSEKEMSCCNANSLGSQGEKDFGCSESRTHILGTKDAGPLAKQHVEIYNSCGSVQKKHVANPSSSDGKTAEEVECNASEGNPSNLVQSSTKNDGGVNFSDILIPAVVDSEKFTAPSFFVLPASGEMQSLELHGDVAAESPDSVVNEIIANNPMDLSANSPVEGFRERDAVDLPNAFLNQRYEIDGTRIDGLDSAGQTKDSAASGEKQSLELHGDIAAELPEPVVNEIMGNNPMDLNVNSPIEGFRERNAVDLPDALLKQRNEIDGTAIDGLDSAGQLLKTSMQTKASPHPCPTLELQVQQDQSLGHTSSSPEVVVSELVGTATNFTQDQEKPVTENQSSATTDIDTVIANQSPIELQNQGAPIVKDVVILQKEVADLERVDSAASVANSEVFGTAKTLQSNIEQQDPVEPAVETQSTLRTEVAGSENMKNTPIVCSNTALQDEDALTVQAPVSLENEVSDLGLADIATPVQSHIDGPAIENSEQLQHMPIDDSPSCNQLPAIELESNSHNVGRISFGAAETETPSDGSTSQSREDVEPQSNNLDVGPGSQYTLDYICDSFQNDLDLEIQILYQDVLLLGGVSHLPIGQVAARNSPSPFANPLTSELERSCKEAEELQKSHENTMSCLKSECAKQIQELVTEVQNKYKLKVQDAQAQFRLKKNELGENLKKIRMNKLLADAFSSHCSDCLPTGPLMLQGPPSSSMQHLQHFTMPAGSTARNSVSNLHTATTINGQATQQMSVPHSTWPGQIHASPSVQAHLAAATSNFLARTGVVTNPNHPTTNPRFGGGDIHFSAPHSQAFTPAAPPLVSAATLSSFLRNYNQVQQQQRPSSSQNPQHNSYPTPQQHTSSSAFGVGLHPLLPGNYSSSLPGMNSSFGSLQLSYMDTLGSAAQVSQSSVATVCLSDDD